MCYKLVWVNIQMRLKSSIGTCEIYPICDVISKLKQLLGNACACAQSVGEKREFKHMVPIRICVGMMIECERKLPSMVL